MSSHYEVVRSKISDLNNNFSAPDRPEYGKSRRKSYTLESKLKTDSQAETDEPEIASQIWGDYHLARQKKNPEIFRELKTTSRGSHFFRSEWNLPYAKIVPFPRSFSRNRVNMRDGMPWVVNVKRHAFSSGWSINSENCLPLCNDHSIRVIWLNGKHPCVCF